MFFRRFGSKAFWLKSVFPAWPKEAAKTSQGSHGWRPWGRHPGLIQVNWKIALHLSRSNAQLRRIMGLSLLLCAWATSAHIPGKRTFNVRERIAFTLRGETRFLVVAEKAALQALVPALADISITGMFRGPPLTNFRNPVSTWLLGCQRHRACCVHRAPRRMMS